MERPRFRRLRPSPRPSITSLWQCKRIVRVRGGLLEGRLSFESFRDPAMKGKFIDRTRIERSLEVWPRSLLHSTTAFWCGELKKLAQLEAAFSSPILPKI